MKTGVFINYRREDSGGHAGRLYDRLADRFGKEKIFRDVDSIMPGQDFSDVLDRKVTSCDAVIALIGKSWLTCSDPQGRRRLDDPQDFVRMEIAAALARQIPVIPVLVGGALMPRQVDLPEAIAALARRQAIEISDTRFDHDTLRLIEVLEKIVGAAGGPARTDAAGGVRGTALPNRSDVSGSWKADNPGLSFDDRVHPMHFTFKRLGEKLLGTMTYAITGTTKLLEGQMEGDMISFKTKHAYVLGSEPEHPYTFEFFGKVSGDEISFIRQGEKPGLTFKNVTDEFIARRVQTPG